MRLISWILITCSFLSSISFADPAFPWKYKIVFVDCRWPDKPFVLLVDKSNNNGIQSLEDMFAYGKKMGYGAGYIGIPSAAIRLGREQDNLHQWSYHMDSKSVTFGDLAAEVCDGTFWYVEDNLDIWIAQVGRYCPWNASQMVKQILMGDTLIFGSTDSCP